MKPEDDGPERMQVLLGERGKTWRSHVRLNTAGCLVTHASGLPAPAILHARQAKQDHLDAGPSSCFARLAHPVLWRGAEIQCALTGQQILARDSPRLAQASRQTPMLRRQRRDLILGFLNPVGAFPLSSVGFGLVPAQYAARPGHGNRRPRGSQGAIWGSINTENFSQESNLPV